MERYFNITGSCNPQKHYMVNLESRLAQIKKMIEMEQYFCINRGRQHGKTTVLQSLEKYLSDEYIVVGMDFQFLGVADFDNVEKFVIAFAQELKEFIEKNHQIEDDLFNQLKKIADGENGFTRMSNLFRWISLWCENSSKPVVLLIDEVDQASNNQIFLDFLAQLRAYYLNKETRPTFQSVILAGVHDIKNLRQKIRPDTEHKHNSPWNIASPFDVDMSFSPFDIAGMLEDYENDKHTGMSITKISQMIYDYTSGYPVLVSSICKFIDEKSEWNENGILQAVNKLLKDTTPLFESLINKIEDNPDLYDYLYQLLIDGKRISYNPDDSVIKLAMMYGFVKEEKNSVVMANRIFETRLYNAILMSKDMQKTSIYQMGNNESSQFIDGKILKMDKIIEKFIVHFNEIYGDETDKFKENDGRKFFLLYLRPIINGIGNYYIEAETRNHRRTDIVVDFYGVKYVIELKIWHGDEYNSRGEEQLLDYLDFHKVDKGYMMSFNFNKNKQVGVHEIKLENKTIIEGVV